MLLGEHAVLHGRRALVCAIDQRMTVSLMPLADPVLQIISDLGNYEAPLDALEDHSDFRFVLDAVKQYSPVTGLQLNIESDFSSDIGFGSSAAVTVATHAVLSKVDEASSLIPAERQNEAGSLVYEERLELFSRSLATVRRVQGRGSGSDVAASVFGGLVAYRAEPLEIVPLNKSFPLTAVYSGSKMKTADVIRYVEERRALNAEYYERIFDRMDTSVGEVIENVERLGDMLNLNQKLMEEMGLCNKALAEIVGRFQEQSIPAKISGSGLGDCAVGLGRFPENNKFPVYPLKVASNGVIIRDSGS